MVADEHKPGLLNIAAHARIAERPELGHPGSGDGRRDHAQRPGPDRASQEILRRARFGRGLEPFEGRADLGIENVILVQVEGLTGSVLDHVKDGHRVTPFLGELAERDVRAGGRPRRPRRRSI